jgi:hypothetical protein
MSSVYTAVSICFWEEAATKIPEKITTVLYVSAARLSQEHKMSATTNSFFFRKTNGPRKPEMFSATFDCCYFDQANPA